MSEPTSPVLEIHSGIVLKGQLCMVKDVILTGRFDGELQTLGCLTVASGGVVTGSIDAGALVLEPGNLVEARVKISTAPKPVKAKADLKAAAIDGWKRGFQKLKDFALRRG